MFLYKLQVSHELTGIVHDHKKQSCISVSEFKHRDMCCKQCEQCLPLGLLLKREMLNCGAHLRNLCPNLASGGVAVNLHV